MATPKTEQDECIALAKIRREVDGTNRPDSASKKSFSGMVELEQVRAEAIREATRRLGPARIENIIPDWRR